MKPNLWIINQYSVTPEYPASSRHYELAKYLKDTFAVTLWGSNFIHHNKTYRFSKWKLFKRENIEGFHFLWLCSIAYRGNSVGRIMNMIIYAIWLLIVGIFYPGRPSIILGSSPSLFCAFSSLLISKIRRAKFVLEVRDLWPDSFIQIKQKYSGMEIRILKWMEKILYKNASLIVVLTNGIGQNLNKKGVPTQKILFLPNGIDLDSYDQLGMDEQSRIRETYRKQFGIGSDDYVFMYAGALGESNYLQQLLDAMSHLKEYNRIKLVLMGDGSEKGNLFHMAVKMGLTSNVQFLPAVPKNLVNHYLTIADAYIISLKDIPLFEGALPNKLFDYLLMNKPIITTVRGEIYELLRQYGAGYYGNMNETGQKFLPQVMKQIAKNQIASKGSNGLQLIRQYYDRKKQAKELANKLVEIIDGIYKDPWLH